MNFFTLVYSWANITAIITTVKSDNSCRMKSIPKIRILKIQDIVNMKNNLSYVDQNQLKISLLFSI